MVKIFLYFFMLSNIFALDFTINTRGECDKNCDNTVLVFGGIQGDEPGGFHAASLLLTNYTFTKGKVIVVPNLAFDSIIARNRGTNGDLNRKFAAIKDNDPDFNTIQRIKSLILLPEVKLIVNLHDGSGYFSPKYISKDKNPNRWGNSCIIDQKNINAKYGNLEEIASNTCASINERLLHKLHSYHLKNTNTKDGDEEMLKSLTYFAITNKKAAFANEASKDLPTHERAYYHLIALESYLKAAGIEFTRDFDLNPYSVKKVIEQPIYVTLDNRFLLFLKNSRNRLNYIPAKKDFNYQASNELTAIYKDKNSFIVQYGNRFQTRLYLDNKIEYSNLINKLNLNIDKQIINTNFATIHDAYDSFMVYPINGARVNIIGYNAKGDEAGILIKKNMLQKSFSVDKNGNIYRVEVYENDKFIGAILINFKDKK